MKTKLLILFVIASCRLFAQNNYFVDKKGTKIIMDNESVRVILIDKRISYSLVGKTWNKYVKFDDLDYAIVGSSLLKSFNLNNDKKSNVYFVFGESEDKYLIGAEITYTTTQGNMSYSEMSYNLIVTDKKQMILEDLYFTSRKKDRENNESDKVAPLIEKYFSNCPEIMTKLNNHRASILDFFGDTEYVNCTK